MREHIYRPQHKTEKELIADFVIRRFEYDKLMESIKADKPGKAPQHIILQGQRGMGKTTIMYRVFYQVNKDLKKSGIIPVIFSEEQYSIRTLYKLWEAIARYLQDHESEKYAGIWQQMQDIETGNGYDEKCFEILERAINKNKQRLILLIDNFGIMLDKFSKHEQQRLREILITFPGFKIIGGSAVLLESFYKYDKPFFDFFKIIQLNPLNSAEVKTLLLQLDEKHKTHQIEQIIKQQPGRIESLRILTGGVPRTIILLFDIFLDADNGSSIDDLKKLLDLVTPLYKHRMDDLPTPQQEIIDKLALNWDGMSVSELTQRTRMESKVLSAQLGALVKSGIVSDTQSTGKNKFYQLEERFFNIWYLMQHAPFSMQKKVIWLTRFLETMCHGTSLMENAKRFSERLKKEKIHPEYALAMAHAYSQAEGLDDNMRDEIITSAKSLFKKEKSISVSELPVTSTDFDKKMNALLLNKKYAEAKAFIEKASLPESELNFFLGYVYSEELKFNEAIIYYEKAIDKGNAAAMNNLACLYNEQLNDYKKAEKYFLLAINKGNENAMFNLAILYNIKFKDYKKAEKYYLLAFDNGDDDAMFNLGHLYANEVKEFKKAEKYYLLAIYKGDERAMNNLALLYQHELNDDKKAEKYYLMSIDKGNPYAINNLITLYIEQNKKDKLKQAEQLLQKLEKSDFQKERKTLTKARYLIWSNKPEELSKHLNNTLPELLKTDKWHELIADALSFAIAKGLKNYVLKLFNTEGYQLKDRLKVLYYALMKLMEKEYPNEIKKMGKELTEPVTEMVNYIKNLEARYK